MAESPSNKKTKTVDFELCFICQLGSKQTDYENYVIHPSLHALEKLIASTNVRCSYGETEFSALKDRISGSSADELLQKNVTYHKTCYKDLTNKTHVEQAKRRYEKGQATGSVSGVKQKKKGRPKPTSTSLPVCTRRLTFDKEMCVICQKERADILHDVSTENMGAQLKAIGQQTTNEQLKVRLSNLVASSDLLTAVAEDMKYHRQCLSHAKEELGLLQRFIVICRSRPEIDLKECIGTYEFGVLPRSLFAADGSLLLAYDKASMLHHLEKLSSNAQQAGADRNKATESESSGNQSAHVPLQVAATIVDHIDVETNQPSAYRVVIIDGMAVVNSVTKTDQIKKCQDFADSFLTIICNMAANYDEVRLVFDRYMKTSLKEQMRTKRTKGKSTYYHVKDTTLIQNISLKDFLSDIRTKAELTEYLADKVVRHSRSLNNRLKKFMVTSGTQTKGNVDIPDSFLTHSQEETDTLLILHAVSVPDEAELVVSSPDTDVLLLLVHMYPHLPVSTVFLTGKGRLKRNISVCNIYNNLGQKRASALLGLHALTGSDMSGRFAGRTKDWCFKAFMSCDDEILDALAMLGNDDDLPSGACSQLERFVCVLYRSKIHTTVKELRWFLYSNRAAEGKNLPPTSGSLDLHIRRAHYIAMIWRKADENHPCLPAPTAFGWTFDAGSSHFSPVRCLNPPAPEAVLHLKKCGCKSGCEGRCSCRKNNIPCTEFCGCWVFTCNNKTSQRGINEECEDV